MAIKRFESDIIINGAISIEGGGLSQFLKADGSLDGNSYEIAFGKNNAFNKNFGTSAETVAQGNDPRLSDARPPISHNHDLRTLINYGDILPVFRAGKNIDDLGSYILAKEDGGWTGGAKPSSSNNAFGVISLQLHTGSYTGQIGLSSQDNKMYYRSSNGGALSSWRSLSFEDHTIQSHAGVLADAQLSGAYTGLTNLTGSGSVDFAKFLGLATDTVTTPSFSWTGDLDTGFYRPTGSQIGVTLAGVQRALFSTAGLVLSGNLGIGGATPGGNLAGKTSIAIGDSDTGFRQNGDGVLETYANNTLVTTQTSSAIIHTRNVTAPVFIGALTGNVQGNLFGAAPVLYSTTLGTAYNQTIQIREKGLNGPQGQSMGAAPRLAFYWSAQSASSIAMEPNGRIAIMNNPGTGYESLIARDIVSSGGSFSGPGTGLTGTAANLTAGYATAAGSATDSTKLPLTGGTLTGEVQTAKRKIVSLNLGSQVDTWYLLATVNTGNSGINIRGTINNHVTSNGVQQFDLSIYGRKDNAGSQIEVSGHYSVGTAGVGIRVVKSGVGTTYQQYDVYLKARAYTQCETILTIQGFTTSVVLYDISNSTTTMPTGTAVEFDNTSDAKGFYSVEASSQSRVRTEGNFTSGITENNWASGDDQRILNGQTAFSWGDHAGQYLPILGKAADSSKLNGLLESEATAANTIIKRNPNGDASVRLIRSDYPNESSMSGGLMFRVNNTDNNYNRVVSSPSAVRGWLELGNVNNTADNLKSVASAAKLQTARTINGVAFDGTGNISIKNIESFGTPTSAEIGRESISTGVYTYNINNGSLGGSTPTTYWSVLDYGRGVGGSAQLATSWTGGGNSIWFRSLRDTTDNWWDWKEILHSQNVGTYTVSKTGLGSTGTWDIGISGLAANSTLFNGLNTSQFLRSDITATTNTGVRTRFGGEITGQDGSSARVQINGFQRTGNIYLHAGGNTPDASRTGDVMSNEAGVLTWTGVGTGKILTAGNFVAGTESVNYAVGNDLRINNGQTAFESLPSYLPLIGGTITGDFRVNGNTTLNGARNNIYSTVATNIGSPTGSFQGGLINYASAPGVDFDITYTRTSQAVWKHKFVNQTMEWRNNANLIVFHGNNAGEVGIGVAPQSGFKLDVSGSTVTRGDVYLSGTLRYFGIGDFNLATGGVRDLVITTNNEKVRIKGDTGNVGIGTTTPSEKLEVLSTLATGSWLKINHSASGREAGIKIRQSTTYGADIYYNDAVGTDKGIKIDYVNVDTRYNALFITPSTNPSVGLGTYTPTEKLEVVGNVKATNFYGALVGNVTGTSSKVAISNHISNNVEYNPVWENTAGTLYYSSDKYKYNPSLGRLTATTFRGALDGNANSATNVGGVLPSQIPFGNTTSATNNGRVDVNTLSKSGFYTAGSGSSNAPVNGRLLVMGYDADVTRHRGNVLLGDDQSLYTRIETGTANEWNAWRKSWDSVNFTSGITANNWAAGDDERILNGQTAFTSLASYLPLIGGDISGGLTISGSLSRGTYASQSNYKLDADNIVLKGNANGVSGIFFESEKNGVSINHPTDFGFIQYNSYGTATGGEANELIIGVSNDGDDHVIFNAPAMNGLKFRLGSSTTDYDVYHSGNIGSQSVNYATTAGTASNGSNINQHYNVAAGDSNGLRFWNGSDSYKVSMGTGSLFQYGTVTDYSIKMQMDQGSTGRGFTWGRQDITPIASLNSTSGNFQTAGTINALGGFIGAGTGLTGTAASLTVGTATNATSADAVSGVALSRIVYGDGARGRSVSKTGKSANTLGDENSSGFYFGNNTTGMPTTDWWNWNGTIGNSWGTTDGYGFQTAGSFWSDDFRMRRLTSGTWQPWVSLIHSGTIGSQSVNYANSSGSASTAAEATNNFFIVRGTSPTIQFVDTDQGQSRYMHHNGGSIGFLNATGGWTLRIADGAGYMGGSFAADSFVKTGGSGTQFLMADGSVSSGTTSNQMPSSVVQIAKKTISGWLANRQSSFTSISNPSLYMVEEIRAVLVCKVANNSYAVGDKATILNGQYPTDSGRTAGQGITIQFSESGTFINYSIGEQLTIANKVSGTNAYFVVSPSQWDIVFNIYYTDRNSPPATVLV